MKILYKAVVSRPTALGRTSGEAWQNPGTNAAKPQLECARDKFPKEWRKKGRAVSSFDAVDGGAWAKPADPSTGPGKGRNAAKGEWIDLVLLRHQAAWSSEYPSGERIPPPKKPRRTTARSIPGVVQQGERYQTEEPLSDRGAPAGVACSPGYKSKLPKTVPSGRHRWLRE